MKLIAYGDSITRGYGVDEKEGWAALLPSLLNIEVFNAGGNGNSSAEGLARFDADVLPRLPALVMAEFGGNDAVEGDRNVSPEAFESNLIEIHRRVVAVGGRVALASFPPIIDDKHAFGLSPYYKKWGGLDNCVEQYRAISRALAVRLNLPLFDMDAFLRPKLSANPDILLDDGVHLSVKGNKFVAAAIASFLSSLETNLLKGVSVK